MREVATAKPIEIHILVTFLCNEALCFDVSERKFVKKRDQEEQRWKQDQRYE